MHSTHIERVTNIEWNNKYKDLVFQWYITAVIKFNVFFRNQQIFGQRNNQGKFQLI